MHFDHLFGPVPSRRLGISLGIDLVPYKTCSLNCVYCECGATTDLTLERKEYAPTNAVISELKQFLSTSPKLDYITFSGAGEPTLHSGIGQIVEFLKNDFPHYKTALLTNGTLFYQQILINEVKKIDLILPSLDAASDPVFRKIDRPVKGLGIQNIITGLVNLRSEFPGTIWLEIFIVPGVNDSEEEIKLLREAIHRIRPDQVQLNTLDRPGTESWVKAATKIKLENIAQHLDWETDIIANFQKREHIASYNLEIEDAIIQTLKRRPCTSYDLSAVLGSHPNEINKYLDSLLKHKRIRSEEMERGRFYKISDDI
ncbi:radical SAM protein [candidate division KSB1 bacterium]|nr:radical SAM protein [candidate division KSB1 bacterium]